MHVEQDYLKGFRTLLDQWADDIDRLDIRKNPGEECETRPLRRDDPARAVPEKTVRALD